MEFVRARSDAQKDLRIQQIKEIAIKQYEIHGYDKTEAITDDDYNWLGKDFFAISFEKAHSVREDHENLFNNKEYQSKLSARQMLELAQEDYEGDSYREVWD